MIQTTNRFFFLFIQSFFHSPDFCDSFCLLCGDKCRLNPSVLLQKIIRLSMISVCFSSFSTVETTFVTIVIVLRCCCCRCFCFDPAAVINIHSIGCDCEYTREFINIDRYLSIHLDVYCIQSILLGNVDGLILNQS